MKFSFIAKLPQGSGWRIGAAGLSVSRVAASMRGSSAAE